MGLAEKRDRGVRQAGLDGPPAQPAALAKARAEDDDVRADSADAKLADWARHLEPMLRLADAGKLSVDDDVHKYNPELQDYGETVTLWHMLTHTRGLRDQWRRKPWLSA